MKEQETVLGDMGKGADSEHGKGMGMNELEMYLQFAVSASDEKIIGAEALARWNSPGKGVLQPDAFMKDFVGQESGLKLDLFTFERVCGKLDIWKKRGWKNLSISCNFSRKDFLDSFLAERMIGIAERYDFERSRLIIEIMENAVDNTRFLMRKTLQKLRDFGFRIALDDFGAGSTSIHDIQMLPLDILKLDRSILRYASTPSGEKVLRELTEMGKRLQYMVVCEGVETEEDMLIARRAGVDVLQGFMYYVPVPEKEADRILEQHCKWNRDHRFFDREAIQTGNGTAFCT